VLRFIRRAPALLLLVWLALTPARALAVDVHGATNTIPYYYSETIQDKEKSYLALYQFVDFEADNLGTDRLDIYFSGWGRGDTMTKMDPENKAIGDAQLDAAFVRWSDEQRIFDASLGRRLISMGPVLEQVDGLLFQIEPSPGFGLQGFGGAPVFSKLGERDGDWEYGGRLYAGWTPFFEIGVSAANRTEANEADRTMVGGDLSIFPDPHVDVLGHAYYDVLYGSLYDANGTLLLRPAADMKVLGQWEREMPSAYLGMSSFFSVFTFGAINKVNAEWKYIAANRVALSAEYNNYTYDDAKGANRYGGSIGVLWGDKRDNTFDVGLHRLDRSDNGYLEARAYFYQDILKKVYLALDGVYYKLDEEIYNVDDGFVGTGTLGWHVVGGLDVQASGVYLSSPYYDSDVRGLMRIAYNFGAPPQTMTGK
jgi:hypothetical protein